MSTRDIIAVSGAAIGAWIGGPFGAQIGFTVGYTVGSYVDPIKLPHPGLSDAPIQTSRDGVPIVIIHGLHYCHGNVIQKNPEEVVTTYERQGKGGGPEVEKKSRFRTFAIGICEGPISGLSRIWENNRLVYDSRSTPAIPVAESNKYAEDFTLYRGDEAQLPDPELEAHWGADETPAYRGLAYIVFNSKDLTEVGGSIPQFAFEVNGSSDVSLTSRPYPIEATDGIQATPESAEIEIWLIPSEGIDSAVTGFGGDIREPLLVYDDWPPEGIDGSVDSFSGTITTVLLTYDLWPPEGIDSSVDSFSGTIVTVLLTYENWPPEGIQGGVSGFGGTIT